MYDIQSKSDFQAGATLIVKIPEHELDEKALYTIQADKPDFILPFRHRAIDGHMEFTYQVGNHSKLTYVSGSRTPRDYAELWFHVLQPLLDCGDWFLTPYSFVLTSEHLYYDKSDKSIRFVYIPAVRAYSDYDMLKGMVTDVAKQNRVTDMNLENKVVWSIQDFNPKQFLQMMKPYEVSGIKETVPPPSSAPMQQRMQPTPTPPPLASEPSAKPVFAPSVNPPSPTPSSSASSKGAERPSAPLVGDIAIRLPADGKAPKEEKTKGGLFGSKKEKVAKEKAETKTKGGFWGKKNKPPQEIIQGAAATLNQAESVRSQPLAPLYTPPASHDDDVTELDIEQPSAIGFRYVGHGDHPPFIEVHASTGAVFTIGRFDASIGTKQSSFEFDKRTKSVSRRHAAVERSAHGYSIIDLASSAGTFLNGQKLPPNAPFQLESGFRVSFGSSGADYVWEE